MLPEMQATQQDLEEWFKLKKKLDDLKFKESSLRRKIFGTYFPDPKEGTNTFKMPDGFHLKAVHPINRKVDEAALQVLRGKFEERGIIVDNVLRWKPEVATREYKALSEKDRKFFDQCLVITDGSPQLSIVKPKK